MSPILPESLSLSRLLFPRIVFGSACGIFLDEHLEMPVTHFMPTPSMVCGFVFFRRC